MEYEKKELIDFRLARKELSSHKYVHIFLAILGLIQTFQIELVDNQHLFFMGLWLSLLSVALRGFLFEADEKVCRMVEKAINESPGSIAKSSLK